MECGLSELPNALIAKQDLFIFKRTDIPLFPLRIAKFKLFYEIADRLLASSSRAISGSHSRI